MTDPPLTARDHVLTGVACLAAGVIVGAAYSVVAPPLAPYAAVRLNGWWFALVAFACAAALGLGIGHRRPRAVLGGAGIVSALSSMLYALMLALPAFAPNTPNINGLVNYALTQASVTFFIVAFLAFPGAIAGLLVSYVWYYR